MTAIPQSASSPFVSDRITKPLREIAQRQWIVLAAVGIFQTLIIGLASILAAALLLGFLQDLWMPVRVTIAALAWGAVIWSAVRFLRPAMRRWSLSRAAMHVEQTRPNIEERLSSAVEIGEETDERFRGSDLLVSHLVRQAEADAGALKPDAIVRNDPIVRWALFFVPVFVAWLLIALLPATTRPALAGLYRVLMPWKDTLPAILSKVVVKPGSVTIIAGEPLEITAHVSISGGDADAGHAQLVRRYPTGQKVADEMERTAARDFRIGLPDLQQGFQYLVSTDRGDSALFEVIVHPRPVITSLELRYDFPKYTALEPKIESQSDGTIEALVGTKVTLTVHTALPIVIDKSHLVIDEGKPEQVIITLTPVAGTEASYQAKLTVAQNAEYRIRLTNQFDLTNKDEKPRNIVAHPDEVPTIVIESPETQVTVRPDDTVPVKYVATDDFGVAQIEAILQVDDRPSETVPVKFSRKNKTNVTGPAFDISVADVLSRFKLSEADHITYQLKVTDNRDPDPQFSFSNKQTLKINKNEWQSFQDKMDQKLAQDLVQAIQKTINQIDQNKPRVERARDAGKDKPLDKDRRREIAEARDALAQANKELDEAAEKAKDTAFDDVARKVRDISDNPLKNSAEDAARAELNSETPDDRHEAAEKSVKEMAEAREALQKLIEKQEVQHAQQKAEATRELAEAARKQREAAEKMRQQQDAQQDPQAQQQAMQKQQEAVQKLQQALQKTEALRDPKAEETARKLRELVEKVEALEKQESSAVEQQEKQQAANEIQAQGNDLAKQQEELNKEIAKTSDEHKPAIQQASASPPNADQQNNIVKELNENKLHEAHDAMKNAANQLRQETQQLQSVANKNDVMPTPQQQEAMNQQQQDIDKANDKQNQATQAADALKQEAIQNAVPKVDDAAVQKAEQLAQDIQKQAAQMKASDAEAQKAADAANTDAQAAEKAAQQATQEANARQAREDLQKAADAIRKAGQELAQAARQNQKSSKAKMLARQRDESQHAADEAKIEAEKQEQLAKALEPKEQQLIEVQREQQPPDQAAQQQQQLAEQTRQAEHQAQELQHQADSASNENVAHRAREAQAELAQAEQHEAKAAEAEKSAAQAERQAAQAPAAEQAQAAEAKAGEHLQHAAQEQGEAQEALAKAENILRELPQELAKGDEAGQEQAEEHGADQGKEHGEDGGHGRHHGSPQQAMQQAAQGAQEAKEAQQEAQQQNPAAAQEAARALADAAQAMAHAVPGALHPGEPEQGQEPGNEPGEDSAQAMDRSTTPGRTADSKTGITALDSGGSSQVPVAVKEIGVTADQWAKLPPLVQKDLLNAAQQSGPPSYRQMIKDYYVRIAKMREGGAAPSRRQQ